MPGIDREPRADGSQEWVAPAKINLSLVVSSPRSDGFHPIVSLAQTIDWSDRLQIENQPDGGWELCTVTAPDLVGAEEVRSAQENNSNLVYRAAHRWAELNQEPLPPWRLTLTKSIPIGAGLGGGSSDAAAILAALHEHTQPTSAPTREYEPSLADMAAEIGSDVAFFLQGGTCWLEGRGEQITPYGSPLDKLGVVVVCPPHPLSTAEVYQQWDRLGYPLGPTFPSSDIPPQLRRWEPLRNDLYPAAVSLYPELAELRSELAQRWGRMVAMTGSGPSLFGLFSDLEEATAAKNQLENLAGTISAAEFRSKGVSRR